jgi:NitT/TauT family transport system substrate-binding protein
MKWNGAIVRPGCWFAPRLAGAIVAALAFGSAGSVCAETATARVATQFGLAYLPLIVMEHDHVWEKKAEAAGIKLSVEYQRLGGGGSLNDALLSDSVDMVAGGSTPMLILWDHTLKSLKVRGVAALNAAPLYILTNKPNVKSVKDFGPDDKIAVGAIRASYQALVLMAAAERAFGEGQASRLDNQVVAMQHPDALAALISPNSQIAGYVATSPFQERALQVKGISKVTDSYEAFGGPGTQALVYAKQAFISNNPKVVDAFHAALREAVASIEQDRGAALDKYLAVTREKTDRALLEAILARPDFSFGLDPLGTLQVAQLMFRIGLLKHNPASWREYFFERPNAGSGS